MIQWFREKYERFLPVLALLSIAFSAIYFAVIGYGLGSSKNMSCFFAFLGFVIGLFLGILGCIFSFGFIGIILEIRDILLRIENGQQIMTREIKNITDSSSKTWLCTKCGHSNPVGTLLCENCKN